MRQPVHQRQTVQQPGQRIVEGLVGESSFGLDLGGDVPGDPEGADDLAVSVPQRHLRRRDPGAGAIAEGLLLDLGRHGPAGSDDPLLVGQGGARMLAAEHVEIGPASQFAGRAVRGVRGEPARAHQEEPALPILEVHPLFRGGQQIAHAGEHEFAPGLAGRQDLRSRPGPRRGIPRRAGARRPFVPRQIAPQARVPRSVITADRKYRNY